MAKNDMYVRIGTQLKGEATQKAHERAKALFGDPPPGSTDMTDKEFIAYWQRNWNDPDFRLAQLERVGAENFRNTVIEMFGGNEAVWPMPEKGAA